MPPGRHAWEPFSSDTMKKIGWDSYSSKRLFIEVAIHQTVILHTYM
jgi:hypothetical protein